jgi:NAD(P)-dependent dehydrogenase (short-subunit alcohol dehydrogenase family)
MYQTRLGREGATDGSRLAAALPIVRRGNEGEDMSDLNGKVAQLVVFLASDDSSFSTGAEFVVDGGESQCNPSGGSLSAILGPQGMFSEAA